MSSCFVKIILLILAKPALKHHLRKEKNCLNCGAVIPDRYCSHCGQENLETRESLGHLVGHFLSDITHYDSKFLTTLRDLLFKPGFLTREYFAGRRMSYLNPIRMYVFISALFFLVLFIRRNEEENANEPVASTANPVRQQLADSLRKSLALSSRPGAYDSIRKQVISDLASSLDTPVSKKAKDESLGFSFNGKSLKFTLTEDRYNSVQEYDSVQKTLPDSSRNKGFMRWLIRTNIDLKARYGSRRELIVTENFQHSIPKLMFVLLPLFALLIMLFYIRKKYYYTQHLIFSLHFHSFMFILLIVRTLLIWLLPYWEIPDILRLISLVVLFIYLGIALKNVYHQSKVVSFGKALGISLLYFILLIISIMAVILFSFFTA